MAPNGNACNKIGSLEINVRNKVLSENVPTRTLILAVISRGT
jgi:hypothetical protein